MFIFAEIDVGDYFRNVQCEIEKKSDPFIDQKLGLKKEGLSFISEGWKLQPIFVRHIPDTSCQLSTFPHHPSACECQTSKTGFIFFPRGRRVQTTGHKFNKFGKKCLNCGISWPYFESLWEMHWNKYKHAWYRFINSWNSRFKFQKCEKANTILISKWTNAPRGKC